MGGLQALQRRDALQRREALQQQAPAKLCALAEMAVALLAQSLQAQNPSQSP